MENIVFTQLKKDFAEADVEGKIEIYVNAEGLSHDEYKELLKLYPISELGRLEAALEK